LKAIRAERVRRRSTVSPIQAEATAAICLGWATSIERINMRGVLVAVAAATVVAVTGCSGAPAVENGAASPGPRPAAAVSSPAPVPTIPKPRSQKTTSPTPVKSLSRRQAAIRYLAIVKPYNVALERLEKAINTGRSVTTLRASAAAVASANQAHMRALRNVSWPLAVRASVRELHSESTRAQVYWLRASRARSRSELIQAVLSAARHDGTEAAGRIRHLLNLRKYEEGAYS
jgi:hypothetical protein